MSDLFRHQSNREQREVASRPIRLLKPGSRCPGQRKPRICDSQLFLLITLAFSEWCRSEWEKDWNWNGRKRIIAVPTPRKRQSPLKEKKRFCKMWDRKRLEMISKISWKHNCVAYLLKFHRHASQTLVEVVRTISCLLPILSTENVSIFKTEG